MLAAALGAVVPPGVRLVDSAATTARAVAALLAARGLARSSRPRRAVASCFLATDGPERFARVGSIFLGRPVAASEVELIDVGVSLAGTRGQRAVVPSERTLLPAASTK